MGRLTTIDMFLRGAGFVGLALFLAAVSLGIGAIITTALRKPNALRGMVNLCWLTCQLCACQPPPGLYTTVPYGHPGTVWEWKVVLIQSAAHMMFIPLIFASAVTLTVLIIHKIRNGHEDDVLPVVDLITVLPGTIGITLLFFLYVAVISPTWV